MYKQYCWVYDNCKDFAKRIFDELAKVKCHSKVFGSYNYRLSVCIILSLRLALWTATTFSASLTNTCRGPWCGTQQWDKDSTLGKKKRGGGIVVFPTQTIAPRFILL